MESLHSEPDDLNSGVGSPAYAVSSPVLEQKVKRKRSRPRLDKPPHKQVPYQLVTDFMPRELLNGCSIPKPRSDLFKKKDEIVERVKAYSKEAGFSIKVTQVEKSVKDSLC